MNRSDEMDTILAGWFRDTAPATMPAELHAEVIERARAARQRIRWGAVIGDALTRRQASRAIRIASLGVVLIAILIASLAIAGMPAAVAPRVVSPSDVASPSADASASPVASTPASDRVQASPMTSIFSVPFVYTIPDGSGLKVVGTREKAIAWAVGPNRLPNEGSFGGEGPETGNVHGVFVAPVMTAWGHGSDGRVPLRSTPAGFLADVGSLLFGVELEPVRTTTLDGRAALTTRTAPGISSNHSDLHVDGPITGLSGLYTLMTAPSRLIVADIDGVTVMIQIWASTEDDLAAWMPDALRFVNSIHFVGR